MEEQSFGPCGNRGAGVAAEDRGGVLERADARDTAGCLGKAAGRLDLRAHGTCVEGHRP